ncbi:Oxysterol-binding protein, partial [Backusella circina FSU 941]
MSRKSSVSSGNVLEEDPESSVVLEDGNRSIIMGLIAQLRKGTDLSRVTLPTFILEPRSMLEKFTDFMSHPDLVIRASKTTDPVQRFVEVCRFFLSGWHIKPKGVKKPYNSVLGEFFRCQYDLDDDSKAYYISEQVSHHPPITAYYYAIPEHGIFVTGEAHPKAKFLGNSAATIMKGYSRIVFSELFNETYEITNPNVYARGILFGKMTMEMGDQSTIRCVTSDLICELEFKTKGFFSGQYHSVSGKIKKESTGEVLYDLSGVWTTEIFIKGKNSPKESFFCVKDSNVANKKVEPLKNQEHNESRRLWSKVTAGLVSNDMDKATDEKTAIENKQREDRAHREKEGIEWYPRFFEQTKTDDYEFKGVQGIDYKNLSQTKEHLE